MIGTLAKMKTKLANPVNYQLPLSDNRVELNPLLGQTVKLVYSGQIFCVYCQNKTKKVLIRVIAIRVLLDWRSVICAL